MPELGLVLTNARVQAVGAANNEIAVGSPIWIALSLKNTKLESVKFWIDQSEDSGISIKPDSEYGDKLEMVSRNTMLEKNFRQTVLQPGEEKELDVFLGDFLRIADVGDYRITCTVQIKSDDHKPIVLKASIPIRVAGTLDKKEQDQIIRVLRERFQSENQTERLKAVKSARGIDTPEAVAFLEKAFEDDDEAVQLAAIEAISKIETSNVVAALEKAQSSKYASVRRIAKSQIVRRTK